MANTTIVEALWHLLGMAAVAATINLAYMNLRSTRFRDLIIEYIQKRFFALRDSNQETTATKFIPLQSEYHKTKSYYVLFKMGNLGVPEFRYEFLGRFGYNLEAPDTSYMDNEERHDIEKFSGFFQRRKFFRFFISGDNEADKGLGGRYVKTPDQIIAAACFVVGLSVIILTAGLALNLGVLTLLFWLLFALILVVYLCFVDNLLAIVKFCLIGLLVLLMMVLSGAYFAFEFESYESSKWLKEVISTYVPEALFWLLLISIIFPIMFVMSAHYSMPKIFKEINQRFSEVVSNSEIGELGRSEAGMNTKSQEILSEKQS